MASKKREKRVFCKPKISTITRFVKPILYDKIKPSRNNILVNNEKFAFPWKEVSYKYH